MSAVLVSKENNQAVFTVEIPAEDFRKAIQTAYTKNKHHFSLPGFRKGKVPRSMLERNYGADLFYEDAINEVLPKAFDDAVEELSLFPVAQPEVDVDDIEKDKDLKIKFTVDVKPEPVLGDYEGQEVEVHKYEVTDEQVDRQLEEQREQNARMVPVEREAKDADIATIDFKGFVNDEPFDGGEAEDYELTLGSGSFIPGFEEQLIGHKSGDSFAVNVTFPEDYHENLAGKEARFDVVIKQLREKQLPDADDDFAMDVSDFDTLDEYKADIRAKLQEEVDKRKKIERENAAVQKLIEVSEISVPASMVDYQIDHEYQDLERDMAQMGIGMDQYMKILQKDMDAVREELRPKAEQRLKADLLLEELKKKLEPEVTDEEMDAQLEEMVAEMADDQKEEYRKFLREHHMEALKENRKTQKAVEALVASMQFTEVEHDHDHDHDHEHDHADEAEASESQEENE